MRDRFGRTIDYLRVSVTDRCNLRCRYCVPEGSVELLPADEVLSFEEIAEVTRTAVGMGVTKVRITGGEPLVRRDIAVLVRMLAGISGIRDLAMTTNGTLLPAYAADLAAAGLQRVNISLDTLSPARYRYLTRGGDVRQALEGISAARAAGLQPIKLNCVVAASPEEPDARAVARFAHENSFDVRFIARMDPRAGSFSVVQGGDGGDCARCSRLRLSSTGLVRPCLFSDLGFSVRELGAAEAIRRAVEHKPKAGGPCTRNWIRTVGG